MTDPKQKTSPDNQTRLRFWLFLAVVVAVRFGGLLSYPEVHPDEGFWTQGARNFVRFGDPLRDGRLHSFLCPGHMVLLAGFFELCSPLAGFSALFEPSLALARIFAALLGVGSCLVVADIARSQGEGRPWTFLAIFGLSSLFFLIQRISLLESHQIFWLVLAARLWLAENRRAPMAAGLALGMALLVKSNSIYLLPAFALSCLLHDRKRAAFMLGSFLCACVIMAGGGYLAAWLAAPEQFRQAFVFELRQQGLENKEGVVFHVGRFGLFPGHLTMVIGQFVRTDPFLIVLSTLGLVLVWRSKEWKRADILFGVWLVFGILFQLAQIFVEHRYLTTLGPALAYFAAKAADGLFARKRLVFWIVAALYLAFHLGRLGVGVWRQDNASYWQTVAYFRQEVEPDAKVLGASYLVQSLPQDGFDFYRLIFHYDRGVSPLQAVVRARDITLMVVDKEWREYQNEEMALFVQEKCELLRVIGDFSIYRVSGN